MGFPIGSGAWSPHRNTNHGPFLRSSDNALFVVLVNTSGTGTITAQKSTDGGETWASSSGWVGSFTSLNAVQVGQTVYVVGLQLGSFYVNSFNLDTETWSSAIASSITPANNVSNTAPLFIAVRSSVNYVILHNTAPEMVMGTDYRRFAYSIYSGGSWTTTIPSFQNGNQGNFDARAAVLGADNRVHLFASTSTSALVCYTLSASDSLVGYTAGDTPLGSATNYVTGLPLLYNPDPVFTTHDVSAVFPRTSSKWPGFSTATSQDITGNFTFETVESANAIRTESSNPGALVYDGTNMHALFVRESDGAILHYEKSGSTWSSPTVFATSTTQGISANLIDNAIGVLWNDNGTVTYDSISLGPAGETGAASLSGSGTVVASATVERFGIAALIGNSSSNNIITSSVGGIWLDANENGNYELYYGTLDGSITPIQRTSDATFNSFWPKVNPSNPDHIMFLQSDAADSPHDSITNINGIYLFDASDDSVTTLVTPAMMSWLAIGNPNWSPDGTKFTAMGLTGTGNVVAAVFNYTIATKATSFSHLIDFIGSASGDIKDISWSHDGLKVVYVKTVDGSPSTSGIYTANSSDGSGKTLILSDSSISPLLTFDPYYSPDDSLIAFLVLDATPEPDHWSIAYIPATGGTGVVYIVDDGHINSKPEWVSNTELIFHRLRYGTDANFGIWKINRDGTNLVQLYVDNAYVEEYPEVIAVDSTPAEAIQFATASIDGTADIATTGTRIVSGQTSMSLTGSQLTAGIIEKLGVSSASAFATITTTGTQQQHGAAALSAQATQTATTGATVVTGQSTLSGDATVATQGVRGVPGSSAPAAVATITATGNVEQFATAALPSGATSSAAAFATTSGSASIVSAGSQLVLGFAEKFGTISETAIASLASQSLVVTTGIAALSATVSMAMITAGQSSGSSAPSGSANLSATGYGTALGQVNETGTAVLAASGGGTANVSTAIGGAAELFTTAYREQFATVDISSTGSQLVLGFLEKFGTSEQSGNAALVATGDATVTVQATVEAVATLSTGSFAETTGIAAYAGEATISVTTAGQVVGAAAITGTAVQTTDSEVTVAATMSLIADATVTTTAFEVVHASATIASMGSQLTLAFAEKFSASNLTVLATFSADGSIASENSASMSANASLTSAGAGTAFGVWGQSSDSTVAVEGHAITPGALDVQAVAALTASGDIATLSTSTLVATASITIDALIGANASAQMVGQTTTSALAYAEVVAEIVALDAHASLSASSEGDTRSSASLSGFSQLGVDSLVESSSSVVMQTGSLLVSEFTFTHRNIVTITASGSLFTSLTTLKQSATYITGSGLVSVEASILLAESTAISGSGFVNPETNKIAKSTINIGLLGSVVLNYQKTATTTTVVSGGGSVFPALSNTPNVTVYVAGSGDLFVSATTLRAGSAVVTGYGQVITLVRRYGQQRPIVDLVTVGRGSSTTVSTVYVERVRSTLSSFSVQRDRRAFLGSEFNEPKKRADTVQSSMSLT